ncbi:MAG TPA: LPXTG cell wall anchor domain-containing protein [Beutenbergiaceae bacterium]|nr:LPXTG cell wall anchor domain-containing protein [Beutenbergiaceae bacterium]
MLGALGAAALMVSFASPAIADSGSIADPEMQANDAGELHICLGGYTACFFGDPAEIAEWDLERTGLEVEGSGFQPGSSVGVQVGAESVGTVVADANGEIAEHVTSSASAGEHTLTLVADDDQVSDSFFVIDDAQWYADHTEEPSLTASHDVRTVSELASEPIEYYVTDFPYDTPVDVYLNDAIIETVHHAYHFEYELIGDYAPGDYRLEFRHPVGIASHEFSVVADDQGEAPAPGTYEGSSVQTHAGHGELDDPDTRPFSFEVDDSGNIRDLTGEFWWVCVAGGVESGYIELADSEFPATPITVDRPFEITWKPGASDYTLTGVVNADGSANGAFVFDHGPCGNSILSWATDLDGGLPDPDPDPAFEVDPIAPISQWDIERSGLSVTASGFDQDEALTIQIGDETFTTEADFFGDVEFEFTGALEAGTHTLTITTAGGSTSETFEVISDEIYFAEYDETPLMLVVPEVVSESENAPIKIIARDLVEDSTVDVAVNGTVVDSVFAGLGSLDYELTDALGVGEHTIELIHPAVSISGALTVVPDVDADPAPAGTFTGTAEQPIAGTAWSSEVDEFDVTFTVDDAGNISGFSSEYRWVCWLSPDNPTGTINFDGMPPTRVTSDRAFAVNWSPDTTANEVTVYGTVNADGSASGTILIDNGSCGYNYLHWSATGDGDYDPAPIVDPEIVASTDQLTTSELADSGILFTGTGFPPGNTVTLSVNSTDIETQSADSEGTVSFTFISDTLSTGSHTAVLSSGDLSASMVFTVLNDNEDPGDAEGEDPDDTDGKDPDDTDGKDPDRLDTLPETGIGSDGLVALGALLILSAAAILGARVRA